MVQKLDDILEGFLDLEADKVTLEWESGGIEVTMYRHGQGVGGVVPDPTAGAIVDELVRRARLEKRAKGRFDATIRDRQMQFIVEEYDHFGETAFEIRPCA